MFSIKKSFTVKNGNIDTIFGIISDFEKYPEFLPFVTHTSLHKITPTEWDSELRFSLFPFWITERNKAFVYGSYPSLKTVRTVGQPSLFFGEKKSLWRVQTVGEDVKIDFEATFTVKHAILKHILQSSIEVLSDSIVQAFIEREKTLH